MSKISLLILVGFVFCLCGVKSVTAQETKPQLTEEQKKSMLLVLTGNKEKATPLAKHLDETLQKMRAALIAEKPNKQAIKNYKKEISDTLRKLVDIRVGITEQLLKLLTPEQKHLVLDEALKQDWKVDLLEVLKKKFDLTEK